MTPIEAARASLAGASHTDEDIDLRAAYVGAARTHYAKARDELLMLERAVIAHEAELVRLRGARDG